MSCHRYIARWRIAAEAATDHNEAQSHRVAGFRWAGSSGTVDIWVNDSATLLVLPGDRGWIIGKLFRRDSVATTVDQLTPREAEALLASQGQALIDGFWGSYVAILTPPNRSAPLLIRDPSGFMPGYFSVSGMEVCCASDMSAMVAAGLPCPAVDWSEIFAHLLAPELRRQRTCLDHVRELRPGHVMVLGEHGYERMLWQPRDHLTGMGDDSKEISRRLKDEVTVSTGALARGYDRVLASVSGGLDSSIVSAALAGSGQPFTCFTLATADPSGDERRYAHQVAAAFDVDCLDYVFDPERIVPTRSTAQHLPRPAGRLFMQQIEHRYHDAAAQVGAAAVFTGNGGDNVFSFLHSAAPIIDRVMAQGVGWATLGTFQDMCRITSCDLGTMARGVGRAFLRRNKPPVWPLDQRFLTGDIPDELLSQALTPWFDEIAELPPGKRAHVILLMRIQNFIEGYERSNSLPVVAPLLSQPVVEMCLAIPSWKWAEGGINRSMARKAFGDVLPRATILRTAKAGPESLTADVFDRAMPVLREHLLDGLLQRHGLIDRVAVEEALTRTATRRSPFFHRLLALAEAEAWSRSWTGCQAG